MGIPSPDMPLAAAVDAAGASGVDLDLDAFPLLVVPTWHLSAKERATLRLPFTP